MYSYTRFSSFELYDSKLSTMVAVIIRMCLLLPIVTSYNIPITVISTLECHYKLSLSFEVKLKQTWYQSAIATKNLNYASVTLEKNRLLCRFPCFLASLSSLISGSDEDTPEVSQTLPSTPQKEGEKEGEEGELKKQEMLVQYLKDTETFALKVERAIFVINSMLYWKTTSGTTGSSPTCGSNVFSLISSHFTFKIFDSSGPGGCAVLCDSTRVQCCQLGQRSSEDVAFGLVDRCGH